MKKVPFIFSFLLIALFLLPGVMGSEGWGETLEISGEVTVAEETPDESEDGTEDDTESGSASSGSSDSESNSTQPILIEPNTAGDDYIWIVEIKED